MNTSRDLLFSRAIMSAKCLFWLAKLVSAGSNTSKPHFAPNKFLSSLTSSFNQGVQTLSRNEQLYSSWAESFKNPGRKQDWRNCKGKTTCWSIHDACDLTSLFSGIESFFFLKKNKLLNIFQPAMNVEAILILEPIQIRKCILQIFLIINTTHNWP